MPVLFVNTTLAEVFYVTNIQECIPLLKWERNVDEVYLCQKHKKMDIYYSYNAKKYIFLEN